MKAASPGRVSGPLLVAAALLGAACGERETAPAAGDWPRFRGHGGSGVNDSRPLPTEWSEGSAAIRWSADLPGFGSASPIVAAGRVYLPIAERDGDSLDHGLVALDADSGELLWKSVVSNRKRLQLKNRFGVWAGATPAFDGRAIYAYFGAELAALDPDGNILWTRIVEDDFEETTRYGAGSSPVVVGEAIVILQDREYANDDDVGWLAAFDRSTGEPLWRNELDEGCCSYVTPVARQTGTRAEVLVALTQKVAAYDAESGELLWEDAQDMNQPVASPVLDGDLLCVASGAHNVRETVCRRLRGGGLETEVEVLWRTHRTVGETASPVLWNDRLYVLTQKGMITAYDALSGRILWRERLRAGAYHASLVAGDGKLFAFNNDGVTTVLSASEEGGILAVNDLAERASIATPAIAGGRIYLRMRDRLICIEASGSA